MRILRFRKVRYHFSPEKNMSRFSKRKSNKTINLAGGIALKHSPEMELIVSVLSTFLEDKFYESGDERIERIRGLMAMVKPEFVAKLAIVARRDFHLRSVSHLLVGELAKIHRGDSLISKTIQIVAERPDDLIEIVAYVQKPVPKQVKKGIRHALLKFNPYQLAKYKNEEKDVKLVDLFNLVHPNPKFASKVQKKAWKDLIKGKLKNEETWEARLSAGEDKKKVWRDMILEGKLGYMALLRNLRNINEQADAKTIKEACKVISNKEEVKKSKQLPFRFYNAYKNVSNQEMLEAVAQAMEYSLDNVPKFKGKTLVAVDSSGSMSDDPIEKASIFAAALLKANDADLILYDTSVKEMRYLRNEPILTLAEKIQREAMGGGTNTSLVFDYAAQSQIDYDRIVILSDNESWVDSDYFGRGTNATFSTYRKLNDCYVYAIDIQGYGTKDVAGEKVFHLCGWSEKMFDFMKWIEQQNELVEFINRIEI